MLQQKLDRIKENRRCSAALSKVPAPYASSDEFKLPSTTKKLEAKRWDDLFSAEGCINSGSAVKATAQALTPISMMSLGIARPAPEYYPWDSMTIQGISPNHFGGNEEHKSAAPTTCSRGEDAFNLDVVLNYGYAAGSPHVLRFLTEHVEMVHNPPYQDWECALTCGATSALDIIFRVLCDRGDWILTESYSYSITIDMMKAQGLKLLGVSMDEFGLMPDDLELKLQSWDSTKGKKPRVLYTIPTGQNPTGVTQTTERRKAIYEIAERHDLYIVEDDPYYYLQLGNNSKIFSSEGDGVDRSTEQYFQQLPTSYLSIDRSGRVLRVDTFSKIIAPGLRCGWVTGCSQVIDKFLGGTDLSVAFPNGPSQMLLYKLLEESWGHNGLLHWLDRLSMQYRQRLNMFHESSRKFLPLNLCSWDKPASGMFFWIKVDWYKHPKAHSLQSSEQIQQFCLDLEDRIYLDAKAHNVLVCKGSWFTSDDQQPFGVYFRLTFASLELGMLGKAVEKFAAAVNSEFDTTNGVSHKLIVPLCSVTEILGHQSHYPREMGALQG